MEDTKVSGSDLHSLIQEVIQEFVHSEQVKAEPAYKTELMDEKKRREELERRVNELVQENQRSREMAEEAERSASIRSELQRLGVAKVDLAYRAVKDDIRRTENGQLVANGGAGDVPIRDYLTQFAQDNPELLPARMTGGSGMGTGAKIIPGGSGVDLDKIRPGMSGEEMEKVRQEVSRVASQTLRGV